jgi:hypothetical protein
MDNRIDLGHSMQVYEVRPRKDKRGVDLISGALSFGRVWLQRAKRNQQRKSFTAIQLMP